MAMFDWFVVNVAASSLQTDLHAGEAALELIVGGYGFAFASGLITGGRLGDLHGHRRLFAIGMVAFAAASLLCGLAPNAWALVVFRVLQGGTAALMVPQMLALINTMFPAAERPRAMAAYGATIGTGAVAGQVLGGVLLDADLFGMAAGVLTTAKQFGNAVGATVLGTIFFSVLGSASGTGDYVTAMQAAALAGLVVLAIVLAAAFTLPRRATH